MKLHLEHTFDCTPEEYWAMYTDPEFDQRMGNMSAVERNVLEDTDDGVRGVRRLQYTTRKPLPGPMKKALGAERLTYEQINRLDRSASRIDWEIRPGVMPDKIQARGHYTAVAHGRGCRVTVHGDVSVRIPLIGKRIEKAVVDVFERAYEKSVGIQRDLLAERAN